MKGLENEISKEELMGLCSAGIGAEVSCQWPPGAGGLLQGEVVHYSSVW